jgi:hypothetical protein
MPLKGQMLKRLSKRAKRGMRGWPLATVAFYGPDASRATKVVVGIVHSEHEEVRELCDWKIVHGDVRNDPAIAAAMLEFMDKHGVLSVVMSDGLMGCPTRSASTMRASGALIQRAPSGTGEIGLRGSW